jgi:3-oxoacyl-[acyl-carrier protein] reductase
VENSNKALAASDRVALVTGAARGVGRCIAERLAQDGFSIVLCDLAGQLLGEALHAVMKTSPASFSVVADVSKEADVKALLAAVRERFGRLDVLVNNAAIIGLIDGEVPTVEGTTLESWETVLRVNLTGPFLMCREAIPLMRQNRWGRIINIGSRSSRSPLGVPAYGTSKTGLVGLSRYIATETARDGITVNTIAPSRMSTEMTAQVSSAEVIAKKLSEIPIGRLALPQDVSNVVSFLATDQSSFLTGLVIDVNGGSFMS